jgi:hypothetical protein
MFGRDDVGYSAGSASNYLSFGHRKMEVGLTGF